jgi:hypothetical protein
MFRRGVPLKLNLAFGLPKSHASSDLTFARTTFSLPYDTLGPSPWHTLINECSLRSPKPVESTGRVSSQRSLAWPARCHRAALPTITGLTGDNTLDSASRSLDYPTISRRSGL